MDTSPIFDLAVPVRYTLTHRAASDDQVDLVLDLFRGAVQIHSRTIASVDREQAVLVMAKCRRYLQLRGVDAAPSAPTIQKPSPPAKPGLSRVTTAQPLPPTVTPMRPAAGVKPMAVAAMPSTVKPSTVKTLPPKPLPPKTLPTQAAPAKPLSAKPLPAQSGLLAARTAATRSGLARQDRTPDSRMPAPAAAAFDWMFQAV